jgi:hypothetical protein
MAEITQSIYKPQTQVYENTPVQQQYDSPLDVTGGGAEQNAWNTVTRSVGVLAQIFDKASSAAYDLEAKEELKNEKIQLAQNEFEFNKNINNYSPSELLEFLNPNNDNKTFSKNTNGEFKFRERDDLNPDVDKRIGADIEGMQQMSRLRMGKAALGQMSILGEKWLAEEQQERMDGTLEMISSGADRKDVLTKISKDSTELLIEMYKQVDAYGGFSSFSRDTLSKVRETTVQAQLKILFQHESSVDLKTAVERARKGEYSVDIYSIRKKGEKGSTDKIKVNIDPDAWYRPVLWAAQQDQSIEQAELKNAALSYQKQLALNKGKTGARRWVATHFSKDSKGVQVLNKEGVPENLQPKDMRALLGSAESLADYKSGDGLAKKEFDILQNKYEAFIREQISNAPGQTKLEDPYPDEVLESLNLSQKQSRQVGYLFNAKTKFMEVSAKLALLNSGEGSAFTKAEMALTIKKLRKDFWPNGQKTVFSDIGGEFMNKLQNTYQTIHADPAEYALSIGITDENKQLEFLQDLTGLENPDITPKKELEALDKHLKSD